MKITQGFDVNNDGANDIYISRDMPDSKTGCLVMLVLALLIGGLLLFSNDDFRSLCVVNYRQLGQVLFNVIKVLGVVGLIAFWLFALLSQPAKIVKPQVEIDAERGKSQKELDIHAAAAIGQEGGNLSLPNLTAINAASAQQLAKRKGGLALNGLRVLPDDVAEALASAVWLRLDGLTAISDKSAHALARHKGSISLKGLRTLSPDAAKALARHDGPLALNGVTSLTREALLALRANPNVRLPENFELK